MTPKGLNLGKSVQDFDGMMGQGRKDSNEMINDLMNLPKKVIPFKDYSINKQTKTVKSGTKENK